MSCCVSPWQHTSVCLSQMCHCCHKCWIIHKAMFIKPSDSASTLERAWLFPGYQSNLRTSKIIRAFVNTTYDIKSLLCDKYVTCPIKCVSQTSDSPDRNLLCFQCSVIFDSLLARYTLVIFAQGEQYWSLYLDQKFSLVTTLYNGSDEVAGQETFAGLSLPVWCV